MRMLKIEDTDRFLLPLHIPWGAAEAEACSASWLVDEQVRLRHQGTSRLSTR